ncbi:hypothetical protein DFP73DRAFT_586320 [Morchella snyderi]|nr:hypothetical protein DFP73DRAFT_586320 [Morchella snyderi]
MSSRRIPPNRSAIRGINRAQPAQRNVTFTSRDDPDVSNFEYTDDDSYSFNEDDDLNYHKFVESFSANKHIKQANTQKVPPIREQNSRSQARRTMEASAGRYGAVPVERVSARLGENEYYDSTRSDTEASYDDGEPDDGEPETAVSSGQGIPRSFDSRPNPRYPGRPGSEDGDAEFAKAAANLDEFYKELEKVLYPNGEGTLHPPNPAKTSRGDWASVSEDDDAGLSKTLADLDEFYKRNNLLQGPNALDTPKPDPIPSNYQSPDWKEVDAWDSDIEFTRAAAKLDELYTSMGLDHILNKRTSGQGLKLKNAGSSSRVAETDRGKAQVKVTSEGSPYIERAKPQRAPTRASSTRRPHIEHPQQEKTAAKGKSSAQTPYVKRLEQQRAPHEDMKAQVSVPVLNEYEQGLLESMGVGLKAQKKQKPLLLTIKQSKSSQHGLSNGQANPLPQYKAGSKLRREALNDPKEYRNRRIGSYLFVLGILVWLLHNTSLITTIFVPCPRHILLSPVGTAYNISSSIAAIPKAVGRDYGTYKAFITFIDLLGEPSYLDKLTERFETAKALPHYGRPEGDLTANYMKNAHEQFIKINASLKTLFIRVRKIEDFTSDNIVGFLEYLTNQIPHDLQDQLNLPPGWNANVIMDDRRDGQRYMTLRSQRITKEIVKAYSLLLDNIEDLDIQLRNAVGLTGFLVNEGVSDLVPGLQEVKPILKTITDLKGYVAWCIQEFPEFKRGQDHVDDDSRNVKPYNVELVWESVLSFDSDAVGRRKSYRRGWAK